MKAKLLRLHPQDNIVVATAPIKAGSIFRLDRVKLQVISNVPMAGKVATRPIAEGEKIIKFGQPIGHATRNIEPGEWVHTHNLASDYFPTPERLARKPAGVATPITEEAAVSLAGVPEQTPPTEARLEPDADLALAEEEAVGAGPSSPEESTVSDEQTGSVVAELSPGTITTEGSGPNPPSGEGAIADSVSTAESTTPESPAETASSTPETSSASDEPERPFGFEVG